MKTQYALLLSYVEALKENGHKAKLEVADGIFKRLCIIYREGIQTFPFYAACGISIDGTFMKTTVGGTLLVACFRNGNGEIQIIGIDMVSIENEDNWAFFSSSCSQI
ncbi:mudra protein [Plasmopara halstedii]|uniref:Mudra protein n=1 Tax=Plasmopara halstedii TaxID=4781 RepID=A0A0P1ACX3_PLAHL|nr:mudra protein [Plasmopara halstedii]CEG38615.1 mudra protein [Plasmopara halstedii]|eukprot:XP_024574984.1 mudra protein [Plasmopara halstedii]